MFTQSSSDSLAIQQQDKAHGLSSWDSGQNALEWAAFSFSGDLSPPRKLNLGPLALQADSPSGPRKLNVRVTPNSWGIKGWQTDPFLLSWFIDCL